MNEIGRAAIKLIEHCRSISSARGATEREARGSSARGWGPARIEELINGPSIC
jgi:hypothetical protein